MLQAAVCGGSPVMPPNTVDPSTNDAPLEFTSRMKASVSSDGLGRPVNPPFTSFAAGLPDSNGMPSLATGMIASPAPWGVPPFVSIPGDPTLMGVVASGYSQCPQFGFLGPPPDMNPGILPASVMGNEPPAKEVLRFPNSVLYPPKPSMPPPATRDRPPGCRTVFVGGLPENATEDVIREVFQHCGEITTIRMSKKNFCHIRFESEEVVDNAIAFSGYRMKIQGQDDASNTGRLHVDYAQARDDQHAWECRQRAIQRELRHRERMDRERLRPPSPPPVVHYSDHEAQQLTDKLKSEEAFQKAVQVLTVWLDRGECSKRNAGHFYSMLQTTNSHVRRLLQEKTQHEEELNRAKALFNQRLQGILIQLGQIEKVFGVASHQKVWDHFTKAQRKNIDTWRKQSQEIKSAHLADVLDKRQEDEMDLSDDNDDAPPMKISKDTHNFAGSHAKDGKGGDDDEEEDPEEALRRLQEEADSLRCQLEAYRNEAELLRSEHEHKDQQLRLLQQALQGVQQQRAKDLDKLGKLGSKSDSPPDREPSTSSSSRNEVSSSVQVAGIRITEKDAKLIASRAVL
ncbi:ecto-NOX disulfide-thiol exchanger 2-like isoform X2 [Ornithodoros turicata]|uniref:ecto-NOX disulfide-thiol exchanger 2-like isoform X2 n=1 Tax=Ornithodoros turicata TaxID=34597 RepID=UPI00313939A8